MASPAWAAVTASWMVLHVPLRLHEPEKVGSTVVSAAAEAGRIKAAATTAARRTRRISGGYNARAGGSVRCRQTRFLLSSLPDAVRGRASTISKALGTLHGASLERQKSRSAPGSGASPAATTSATTASPHWGSGRPTT